MITEFPELGKPFSNLYNVVGPPKKSPGHVSGKSVKNIPVLGILSNGYSFGYDCFLQ